MQCMKGWKSLTYVTELHDLISILTQVTFYDVSLIRFNGIYLCLVVLYTKNNEQTWKTNN